MRMAGYLSNLSLPGLWPVMHLFAELAVAGAPDL